MEFSMFGTTIQPLPDKTKEQIKEIMRYHYGFDPRDEEIDLIDAGLRNNYLAFHDQQIIRELAAVNASRDILANKDRFGMEFDRIWLDKSIFRYLTYANMCFKAGIWIGTISLCRTAIESGLRERLAESLAKKEIKNQSDLPEITWIKLKELGDIGLGKLIQEVDKEGIIKQQVIENLFREVKFKDQHGRRILDKFIHGDIVWMVDYVRNKEKDTRVIGARNELQKKKIVSDMMTDRIAFNVLKATYKIAEIIYYNNTA